LAVSAEIFFAESNGVIGAIHRVGKDGTGLTTIAENQNDPTSIAVAGHRVLWTTASSIDAYPIQWSEGDVYPLENRGGDGGIVSDGRSLFADGSDPVEGKTIIMFENDWIQDNGAFSAYLLGKVDVIGALAVDESYVY